MLLVLLWLDVVNADVNVFQKSKGCGNEDIEIVKHLSDDTIVDKSSSGVFYHGKPLELNLREKY